MDELIRKQAALDALNHELRCGAVINQCGLEMAYEVIEDLPSAEPKIILCKDCKYWHSGSCEYPEHAVNCQDYWVGDIETEAEHFCGYAERRGVTT